MFALAADSINTRPDIAFAVSYLVRFVNAVTTHKFARAVDMIRYLKGTSSFGSCLGGTAQAMNQSGQNIWQKLGIWKCSKREGADSRETGASPHALPTQKRH